MSVGVLDGPVGVDRGALLARANPLAKLAVASSIGLAMILTVDWVTAAAALALQALALPFAGLPPRTLLARARVVLVAALPAAVATAVFGVDGGRVLAGLGPVTVTQGSLTAGVAIGLRVVAIGLPGVVLVATTDPTDLADALAQRLRLPHRFVLAALASLRLFAVLGEEWQALGAARRARGLGDDGRLGRARTALGQVLALLVLALRRAAVLATTMESRGFGAVAHRTWARPSRFGAFDAAVVVGGVLLAVAATAAGLAAGTWRFVLS